MMRLLKKVITLALVATLVLSCAVFALPASAANYGITVGVESKSVSAGDSFDVAVSIKSNPGIISMRLYIEYDSNYLTLTDAKDAGVLGSYTFGDSYKSPYILMWSNGTSENFTNTGTIATLTFTAASNITSETNTLINVTTRSVNDILNSNLVADSITLTPSNGNITISPQTVSVLGVSVSPKSKTLTSVGSTFTLSADVGPSNATNKTVTFLSSNTAVATVNASTGVVTAVADGFATITATTVDGGYTDTCEVEVSLPHVHNIVSVSGVAATCTSTGVTAHYKCTGCGTLFTDASGTQSTTEDELTIAMLPHTPGTEYYSSETSHWRKCTVCHSAVQTAAHSYNGDHTCTVCGYINTVSTSGLRFYGANLTFNSDISVNFFVEKSLITDGGYSDPYVSFSLNGSVINVNTYTLYGNGNYYMFTFNNIAPNKMNDTIYATLYAEKDGQLYNSAIKEYSIVSYCENKLNSTTDNELRTLIVDLLNYGAKSQLYTDYKVDQLATGFLNETQASWGTSYTPALKNIAKLYNDVASPTVSWTAAGLVLNNSVTMRFKFTTDEDISDLTVKVRGDNYIWTISPQAVVATDGGYYVYFDALKAQQMSEQIYIAVYKGTDQVSKTYRYSIESYAYSYQNSTDTELAELVVAMMNYGNSAYAYAN